MFTRGVAVASPDWAPSPAALTARTRKPWAVPLSSPVTVWPVVAAPLPGMSIQGP